MKTTIELLQELKTYFSDIAPHLTGKFRIIPPTEAEIQALESHLGVIPKEYRAFLMANDIEFYFSGNFKVLTVEGVLSSWQCMTDLLEQGVFDDGRIEHHLKHEFGNWQGNYIKQCWWNRRWIPFAQDSCGNMYCIDLDPGENGRIGQLLNMKTQDGQGPSYMNFDDFLSYLDHQLELLYLGKLEWDDHHFLPTPDEYVKKPSPEHFSPRIRQKWSMLLSIRQRWLESLFINPPRLNKARVVQDIHWLYSLAGLPAPELIVTSSPLACQQALHDYANQHPERDIRQENKQINTLIDDAIELNIHEVEAHRYNKRVEPILSVMDEHLISNYFDYRFGEQFNGHEINRLLRPQLSFEPYEFSFYAMPIVASDGPSFDFYGHIGFELTETVQRWIQFIEESGMFAMLPLAEHCFVSLFPTKIKLDVHNYLHAKGESAMAWEDGLELYFEHGSWIEPPQPHAETSRNKRLSWIKMMTHSTFCHQDNFL